MRDFLAKVILVAAAVMAVTLEAINVSVVAGAMLVGIGMVSWALIHILNKREAGV